MAESTVLNSVMISRTTSDDELSISFRIFIAFDQRRRLAARSTCVTAERINNEFVSVYSAKTINSFKLVFTTSRNYADTCVFVLLVVTKIYSRSIPQVSKAIEQLHFDSSQHSFHPRRASIDPELGTRKDELTCRSVTRTSEDIVLIVLICCTADFH